VMPHSLVAQLLHVKGVLPQVATENLLHLIPLLKLQVV
jgi:hypothetical protein